MSITRDISRCGEISRRVMREIDEHRQGQQQKRTYLCNDHNQVDMNECKMHDQKQEQRQSCERQRPRDISGHLEMSRDVSRRRGMHVDMSRHVSGCLEMSCYVARHGEIWRDVARCVKKAFDN